MNIDFFLKKRELKVEVFEIVVGVVFFVLGYLFFKNPYLIINLHFIKKNDIETGNLVSNFKKVGILCMTVGVWMIFMELIF